MLGKCNDCACRPPPRAMCQGDTVCKGAAGKCWESPSWANNSVCVQQVVWWRLQPPASGGYVDIDMPRCLQGACIAWNIVKFGCMGEQTAARKYKRGQQEGWMTVRLSALPLHGSCNMRGKWAGTQRNRTREQLKGREKSRHLWHFLSVCTREK